MWLKKKKTVKEVVILVSPQRRRFFVKIHSFDDLELG